MFLIRHGDTVRSGFKTTLQKNKLRFYTTEPPIVELLLDLIKMDGFLNGSVLDQVIYSCSVSWGYLTHFSHT